MGNGRCRRSPAATRVSSGTAVRSRSSSASSSSASRSASHSARSRWLLSSSARPASVSSTRLCRPSWGAGVRRTRWRSTSALTTRVIVGGRTAPRRPARPCSAGRGWTGPPGPNTGWRSARRTHPGSAGSGARVGVRRPEHVGQFQRGAGRGRRHASTIYLALLNTRLGSIRLGFSYRCGLDIYQPVLCDRPDPTALRYGFVAGGRARPPAARRELPDTDPVTKDLFGIVGGGILGLAVGRELGRRHPVPGSWSSRRRTGSAGTRPGTTPASCTPASTTSPAASRPSCARGAAAAARVLRRARAAVRRVRQARGRGGRRRDGPVRRAGARRPRRTACPGCVGSTVPGITRGRAARRRAGGPALAGHRDHRLRRHRPGVRRRHRGRRRSDPAVDTGHRRRRRAGRRDRGHHGRAAHRVDRLVDLRRAAGRPDVPSWPTASTVRGSCLSGAST